jgi:hypothetical protein
LKIKAGLVHSDQLNCGNPLGVVIVFSSRCQIYEDYLAFLVDLKV